MRIIRGYYFREFMKLFLILTAGISVAFSLVDLIDKIDDFAPHRPAVNNLLYYAALNIPRYLLYLMPMAGLLTSLFVFGQALRRKEIVALKASGGRVKALLMHFVYLGLLLSIISFLAGEFAVPVLSREAHRLRDVITARDKKVAFREGTMWLRSEQAVIKADIFLPDKGIVKGVSILRIEQDILTERIEADSASWRPFLAGPDTGRGGSWHLTSVTVYNLKAGTMTKHRELETTLIDSPDMFKGTQQRPEEMNARELIAYATRLKNAGFRNTKLLVDIHSRVSYPLVNAVMLVLGISLSTMGAIGGGLMTAALGIAISLVYWVVYTTLLSLGYAGILPAPLAAWTIPLLFGGMAAYLFMKIPE